MIESTQDVYTNIINRTLEYVEYQNADGRIWRVSGTCIACGLCESKPEQVPSTVVENNRIVHPDGSETSYIRTLVWSAEPGIAGACVEEGFENRKDIPMTPDFINSTETCTLTGVYINGN